MALPSVHREAYALAVDARDPRFDGVFFVGITTTRVYCRPVCPSRVAYDHHRRFFDSAAAAERAGFRPCLRCRPELAPGRTAVTAVSRLAQAAAQRIAAGALNGLSVADLASELGVSERHLRRSLEREVGVSPLELAQTYRLLLAKRLLRDTDLPVTRVAYASGFQSLRRFNAVFRARYGMPPSALRRAKTVARRSRSADSLRLTLAYRAPFAWDVLLTCLRRDALSRVELVTRQRYARTVRIDGASGVVLVRNEPSAQHLVVEVSASLVPVLMPLIAGLRRVFDLDAEPAIVDAHLAQGGLGALVAGRPGVRLPGALDGFEVALRPLLGSAPHVERVVQAFGEPLDTTVPGLTHLAPTAWRIADAGASAIAALGVPPRSAESLAALARAVVSGTLRLSPGSDAEATWRGLLEINDISERQAGRIVLRALSWPDALPAADPALLVRAEQWRPWRAYAAVHLSLARSRQRVGTSTRKTSVRPDPFMSDVNIT